MSTYEFYDEYYEEQENIYNDSVGNAAALEAEIWNSELNLDHNMHLKLSTFSPANEPINYNHFQNCQWEILQQQINQDKLKLNEFKINNEVIGNIISWAYSSCADTLFYDAPPKRKPVKQPYYDNGGRLRFK